MLSKPWVFSVIIRKDKICELGRLSYLRGCLTEECECIANARPMALSVLKAFKAYKNSIMIIEPYLTILNQFLVDGNLIKIRADS